MVAPPTMIHLLLPALEKRNTKTCGETTPRAKMCQIPIVKPTYRPKMLQIPMETKARRPRSAQGPISQKTGMKGNGEQRRANFSVHRLWSEGTAT